MADFTTQRSFTTTEPVLPVDKGLPVGTHTFELVVKDDQGNRSKAARISIEVVRLLVPVTPITPITPVTPVIPVRPIIPIA